MSNSELTGLSSRPGSHLIHDMHSNATLSNERLDELGIIYPGMENNDLLNTYRDLRNRLLQLSEYKNFVCVVSAIEARGDASLLAINLAAVFAFDRSRSALIIDCDTSWSILDEICTQQDETGLIDFIENDMNDMNDISTMIHESGIDRIRIVPSGKASDTRTEALESVRMTEIVLELKKRYADRFIVINAPNMSLSSEVQILSGISDMLIFEMLSSSVSTAQVTAAIELIGEEKIAGIVFRKQ